MERAIPILPADDLEIAKSFYVHKLGFQVLFEASDDGCGGILGLGRGTIQITIDSPMNGHGRRACVSLEVDSADAYYDEWSQHIAMLRPPRDEPWGARTFGLQDPSTTPSSSWGRRNNSSLAAAHRSRLDHMRHIRAFMPIVTLLMLWGCSHAPDVDDSQTQAIHDDAQSLLNRYPSRVDIDSTEWPESMKELQPRAVRISDEGLYILTWSGWVEEVGVFVPRDPRSFSPEQGADPGYRLVSNHVFVYRIRG